MQLPEAAPMSIWPPLLAVAGPGEVSASHRHHALHVVLCRRHRLRVQLAGAWHDAAGVVTGADVEHAIDATGTDVVLLFVDPESIPGATLGASLAGEASFVDPATRDALVADLSAAPRSSELGAWASEAVAALTDGAWKRPRLHPRVRRLLRELDGLPPDADTSLEALARHVGLSPSRLMHVFTDSVGIPLRPYLRWVRVQRAAAAIVAGEPLSSAAAGAGFSDAAHMSRTFKQMFGLPPSVLQRRSRMDAPNR